MITKGIEAVFRLKVPDDAALRLDPAIEVVTAFEDRHFGTRKVTVRHADGRLWSLPAPAAR